MDAEKISKAIQKEEIFLEHPQFYARAFTFAARQRKILYARDGDNFKRVCMEEYNTLSQRLDHTKFQEACAVRNVLRTRRLANLLINDKGELNTAVLPRLITYMEQNLYSLGPHRQYDAKRQKQLLTVLAALNQSKELVRLLLSISKPVSHKYADQIIRDTLAMSANVAVTDAHARRAVLSAWMCTLRQSVGSCFATAPALIIHDEQPEMFLKDVRDLLNTGRLKRTFGGVEYAVPLSASWGAGDLCKPFYVDLGDDFEKGELWTSPGLLAAFQAIDLVDVEAEIEQQHAVAKKLLQKYFRHINSKQARLVTTAEEILRGILLLQHRLTEQDLKDYENRPHQMIHTGLFMQVASSAKTGNSKGELCALFFNQLKVAGNALKALSDNALLKAWEFSLASLSETKLQFTRWNLYASLGLGTNEKGGIGACVHEVLQYKLDQANTRVRDFQYEYEQMYNQLKTIEARMRSVSSEKEAQWVKVEYQSKRNEFYTLEEMRDVINQKAHRLAGMYELMLDQYDALFPRYFQEVYDADMQDISAGPYDDSPAGFRLLYKYGRSNTAQWAYIHTAQEFVDNLAAFFTATEVEITALPEMEGLQSDLSEIVTAIVRHVRTKEFLETAFYRMAAAHHTHLIKDPLANLDKIDKKPWAYTSGGTMDTLLSCYYKLEHKPHEVARWVESPTELFTFLIDTLRQIPAKQMQSYLEQPSKSMLIHSPTHAFLLKPGLSPFKELWQKHEGLSYIRLRDLLITPQKELLDTLWLDEEKMHFFVEHLMQIIPSEYRYYFGKTFEHFFGSMRPHEFREHLLDGIQKEPALRQLRGMISAEEIDGMLYRFLPLLPHRRLRECVEAIYKECNFNAEQLAELMHTFELATKVGVAKPLVDADQLQNICKGLICLTFEQTSASSDYHALISGAAQTLGLALPAPVIIADSNWVKDYFAFLVNPGTNELEFWRVDPTGRGIPHERLARMAERQSSRSHMGGVY